MNVVQMLERYPDLNLYELELSDINTAFESVALMDILINSDSNALKKKAIGLFNELSLVRDVSYGKRPEYVKQRISEILRTELSQLSMSELEALRHDDELNTLTLYAQDEQVPVIFDFFERIKRARSELQEAVAHE